MNRRAADPEHTKRVLAWLLIGLLLFLFLYAIRSVLLPFVVGMAVAYFLDPAADRLEEKAIPRGIATVLITVTFFAALAVGGTLIVPVIVQQCIGLVTALPDYLLDLQTRYGGQLERWLSHVDPEQAEAARNGLNNAVGSIIAISGEVLAGAFKSGMAVVNVLSLLFITPLVSFYCLRDWDAMTARLNALLPRRSAPAIREQLRRIDVTLAGFIRGQMNVCLLLAVYYAAGLSAAGLRFGLLLGLLTGLLAVLPYVGFLFGCGTAIIVAFIQFGFTGPFWLVAAVFTGGQILESYFLTPRLVGNRVGLHPLWIVFGMLAGGALLGFVGVLLAVPLTAVIGVLTRFALERYLQSSLYKGA